MKRWNVARRLWLVFALVVWGLEACALFVILYHMYPPRMSDLFDILRPAFVISMIPLGVAVAYIVLKGICLWLWRGFRPAARAGSDEQ